MTWPASDVNVTNLDAGGDSAATARGDLLDLFQKFNQLRNHASTFMRGILEAADAAAARLGLGLANHQLVTVDGSANLTVAGTVTAANVASTSDERLKEAWAGLPVEFVSQLASVHAGTFQRKDGDGTRLAGVSAQSLQQLLPEAVHQDADGYLSVSYGPAALVAAIALAREVEELRAEVRRLKDGR